MLRQRQPCMNNAGDDDHWRRRLRCRRRRHRCCRCPSMKFVSLPALSYSCVVVIAGCCFASGSAFASATASATATATASASVTLSVVLIFRCIFSNAFSCGPSFPLRTSRWSLAFAPVRCPAFDFVFEFFQFRFNARVSFTLRYWTLENTQ